jgi:hypothetical protein
MESEPVAAPEGIPVFAAMRGDHRQIEESPGTRASGQPAVS